MGGMDARPLSAWRSAAVEMNDPSYERLPSPRLRQLLEPGGFLMPLLEKRRHKGIDLEAHLRRGNEVHLYCGLTCLVKCAPSRAGRVWVKSHRTYAVQECARRLIRPERATLVDRDNYWHDVWSVDEPGFKGALDRFLDDVDVGPAQMKEGAIQSRWARVGAPWIVFDKEAALSYPSMPERARQLSEAFRPAVDDARSKLRALALSGRSLPERLLHWSMPPEPKSRLKLDALAVDPEGKLVLLEIKDASGSQAEVYYAPFQLLQNVWEWHRALPAVRGSVQELLDMRVELGLTPGGVPRIAGGIRAAVGFGEDERSEPVRQRYVKVLGIVNALLPPGVASIETWIFKGGQPVRLG